MNTQKTFGRLARKKFLLVIAPTFLLFLILQTIGLTINDYWKPSHFLPLQAAYLATYLWFWSAVAARLHDVGKPARLAIAAGVLTMLSKAYILFVWIMATNREFEMGAAIWTVIVEPAGQAAFALLAAFFVFRPSQPGPNKYGPNPHEVIS